MDLINGLIFLVIIGLFCWLASCWDAAGCPCCSGTEDEEGFTDRPSPQQSPSQPRPQYCVEDERVPNHRTIDQKYEFERQQAGEYAEKKNELIRLSKQAYKQNRRAEAKKLSQERKMIEGKMIACNSRAAEIIFKKNNSGRPVDSIDLHRLYVKEAIVKLKERIELVKNHGLPHLSVCVGQGKHSPGEPKLKPAVMQYARKTHLRYEDNSPHRGWIRLFFDEE